MDGPKGMFISSMTLLIGLFPAIKEEACETEVTTGQDDNQRLPQSNSLMEITPNEETTPHHSSGQNTEKTLGDMPVPQQLFHNVGLSQEVLNTSSVPSMLTSGTMGFGNSPSNSMGLESQSNQAVSVQKVNKNIYGTIGNSKTGNRRFLLYLKPSAKQSGSQPGPLQSRTILQKDMKYLITKDHSQHRIVMVPSGGKKNSVLNSKASPNYSQNNQKTVSPIGSNKTSYTESRYPTFPVKRPTTRSQTRTEFLSTKRNFSAVWKYFKKSGNRDLPTTTCILCGHVLKYKGSSTGEMRRHIKSKHKIKLPSLPAEEEQPVVVRSERDFPSFEVKTEVDDKKYTMVSHVDSANVTGLVPFQIKTEDSDYKYTSLPGSTGSDLGSANILPLEPDLQNTGFVYQPTALTTACEEICPPKQILDYMDTNKLELYGNGTPHSEVQVLGKVKVEEEQGSICDTQESPLINEANLELEKGTVESESNLMIENKPVGNESNKVVENSTLEPEATIKAGHAGKTFLNYCTECKKLFSTWSAFQSHMIKHHQVSPKDLLIQKIVRKDDKIQNMNGIKYVKHKDASGELIYCLECVCVFSSWDALERHMRCKHWESYTKFCDQISEAVDDRTSDKQIATMQKYSKASINDHAAMKSINFEVSDDQLLPASSIVTEDIHGQPDAHGEDGKVIKKQTNKTTTERVGAPNDQCIDNTNSNKEVTKLVTVQKVNLSFDCKGCPAKLMTWEEFNSHICSGTKRALIKLAPPLYKKVLEEAASMKLGVKSPNLATPQPEIEPKVHVKRPQASGLKEAVTNRIRKDKVLDSRLKTCHVCGVNTRNMYQHRKTHLRRDRLYICEFCGYQTNIKKVYQNHVDNVHYKIRPHKCTFPKCSKRFFNKVALTNHLTTHSSERKFECSKCHKKYKTQSNLRQHMVTHRSADKRHCCPYCSGTFSYLFNMKTHIRNIHQGAGCHC